jgi:hypothetical protein
MAYRSFIDPSNANTIRVAVLLGVGNGHRWTRFHELQHEIEPRSHAL